MMNEILEGFRNLHWLTEILVFVQIGLMLITANAYLGGRVEGPIWAFKSSSTLKIKQAFHALFTWQRSLAFIPIFPVWAAIYHWWAIFGVIGTVGIFVFIHDSFYYYFRNKADGSYPLGFKDVSTTSSAFFDNYIGTPDWKGRVILAAIGTMFMFIMVYGKYS